MRSKLRRIAALVGAGALFFSAGGSGATPENEGSKAPIYHCVGFDEPIRNEMNVPRGRVLPLRAKLAMEGGAFANQQILKAPPKVRATLLTDKGEVDRTDQIDVRDYGKGTSFVWDAEAHWKFDLGTLKFAEPGRYRAVLLSGDETEYKVEPTCEVVFLLR
jgi:hypothetical protein